VAEIPMNRTEANLLHAFACEMLASRRYLAFAERSEEEDHHQAAAVLRSIAQRKASQADEHLKMLGGLDDARRRRSIRDTGDNLRAAIASEQREHNALYAGMARTARDEGLDEIADWFEMLAKAGRSHSSRFRQALEILNGQAFAG
jgi:rubrerythrin